MKTITIIYLLNDESIDSVNFILSCISEYLVNHPEDIDFAMRLSNQIIHCRDNFTKVYK